MKHSPKEIMIVEDSPDLSLLLVHLLKGEGYIVQTVDDGAKAVQLFEEMCPDLVLLDLILPGLDGWEVCRQVRNHVNRLLAATPIVMVSVFSTPAHRLKASTLGVNDFVAKPFGLREVADTIKRVLGNAPQPGRCKVT